MAKPARRKKTSARRSPILDIPPSVTKPNQDVGLTEAFRDAFESRGVLELRIVISSDHPRGYQTIVKYRDANRPWAVGVEEDPVHSLQSALGKARDSESKPNPAKFAQSKELARTLSVQIEFDHGEVVKDTRIEFVPYLGFVVVAYIPATTKLEDYEGYVELALLTEIRRSYSGATRQENPGDSPNYKEDPTPGTKGRKKRKPPTPKEKKGGKSGDPGANNPYEGWTKKAMMDEYKTRHGKQPNSRIGRDELAGILAGEDETNAK